MRFRRVADKQQTVVHQRAATFAKAGAKQLMDRNS